jgi:inositol transport system permease protein
MMRMSDQLFNFMGKYSIYMVLLVLFVICWKLDSRFASVDNLTNISAQISAATILAFGETILIIAGMLDLSAASVLALSGVVSVYVYTQTESMILAVFAAIVVSVLCNMINGLMVTIFKTPSFIATLAMMEMARGAALWSTRGQDIILTGNYKVLGQGDIFGIPITILFMFGIFLATWYLLKHTVIGRSIYAIGGNEEAANASGVNINRIKMLAFAINGVFVGIAGVLFMSRVNLGEPNGAQGYEFKALTAAIIGGTSFSGGIGSASGTLVGAFIVGFLDNIMVMTHVNTYLKQIIRGTIIALAVIYDINAKNRRPKIKPRSIIQTADSKSGKSDQLSSRKE